MAVSGDESTSTSLLQRIRARDEQAWEHLVYIYEPLVQGWCRRWTLRPDVVGDISQEVFVAVHEGIANFRKDGPKASFRGWLWTITRNKVTDYIRRDQKHPQALGGTDAQTLIQEVPLEAPDVVPDSESGPQPVSPAHRALVLIRPFFEDQTWQAFYEVSVKGRLPKDVASDLGMKPMAVYKAKSRVLQRLRQELEGLLDQ